MGQPTRVDVNAAGSIEDGNYIVDCSLCGPLEVVGPDDVDEYCRDHLRAHGITEFFGNEE